MADAEVTVKDETEGVGTANVDTKSMVGVGGKTVHRQIVAVGDNTTFGQTAIVNANSELKVKDTDSLQEATFTGRINTQGQKTMAASTPVVVASDQSAIPISGTVTANAGTGTLNVDPTDKPARDMGKIDVALLDQYTPIDVDTGAGIVNAMPITWRKSSALGVEFGTSTDPIRNDPTGTTKQPVSLSQTTTDNDVDVLTLPAVTIAASQTLATVTNLVQQNGVAISLNTGVRDTGTQRVTIATNDVVPVTDNAGTLTVDAPVGTPVATRLSDGAAFLTTTTGRLSVDASGVAVPVTDNAGSLTVDQATSASLKCEPLGNVADAVADSGNPIKIAGVGRQTNRTAVADGQRVNAMFDDLGRQVIIQNQVRDLVVQQTTTISTTTETTILAAGAAGVFHDIVLLTIANTSATATIIDFRDITAGAVIFSLYVPAGATIGFAPPVPVKQTTAANVWSAQLGTAVTDVRIFIQGVKNV